MATEPGFPHKGILDHDQRAAMCIACGECELKCPQSIPIREWMTVIDQKLGGVLETSELESGKQRQM